MISILEAGILQRLEKKERNQSVSPNVKLSTCVFSGGTTVCQLDLPSVGVGVGVGAGGGLSAHLQDSSRPEGGSVHGSSRGPNTTFFRSLTRTHDRIDCLTIVLEPRKSPKTFKAINLIVPFSNPFK